MLDFYDVDRDYIEYLKDAEFNERGFTCVPNVDYGERGRKFLCGVALYVAGIKYYVPVSSYKNKIPDAIPIIFDDDTHDQVKGTLRFNFMIPVPDSAITKRVINDEPEESRRIFLYRQLKYCRKNEARIVTQANKTRKKWFGKYGSQSFYRNCCDFSLLEKKCLEY